MARPEGRDLSLTGWKENRHDTRTALRCDVRRGRWRRSCWPRPARQAGPAFFAGRLEDGRFVRDEDVKESCYTIRYSTVTATVDGDAATVRLQETIVGPEQPVRTVCLIPLCEGADGHVGHVSAGETRTATLAAADRRQVSCPPQEAQQVYESLARGLNAVSILALSGRPACWSRTSNCRARVEIVVEFRQQIRTRDGLWRLACPMPATAWARGPVERLSVTRHAPQPRAAAGRVQPHAQPRSCSATA